MRATILLIEDDRSTASALEKVLENEGYAVKVVERGDEGLREAREQPYDLVITDLRMPGLSGLDLVGQLHTAKPKLPIIMMTAHGTTETAIEAMKLGAYDYLVKPFDPDELSMMMQKIVAQQALARENALLRQALKRDYRFRDLVSKSPAMRQVFELARTAARST
ncbi:MAG TPA: response regulator, partial [Verrucomicrobiota bacterium]|nr:response regulator [Verrucomicrobiota bacterium]